MLYGIFILIVVLDQITKYSVVKYLKNNEPFVIIKNFLQFNYVENRGAAFGILQNRTFLFVIITLVVVLVVFFYLKKYFYCMNKYMRLTLVMLMGGAVGNLIDRVRLGYVIDFIDINFGNFYNFPIFNVADIFVVVSTILIVYMVLFNKYEC